MRMEPELVVTSQGRKVLEVMEAQAAVFRAGGRAAAEQATATRAFRITNPNGSEEIEGTIPECLVAGAPIALGGILAAMGLNVGESFNDGIIEVTRLEDRA